MARESGREIVCIEGLGFRIQDGWGEGVDEKPSWCLGFRVGGRLVHKSLEFRVDRTGFSDWF
jgi:hypothetical protein